MPILERIDRIRDQRERDERLTAIAEEERIEANRKGIEGIETSTLNLCRHWMEKMEVRGVFETLNHEFLDSHLELQENGGIEKDVVGSGEDRNCHYFARHGIFLPYSATPDGYKGLLAEMHCELGSPGNSYEMPWYEYHEIGIRGLYFIVEPRWFKTVATRQGPNFVYEYRLGSTKHRVDIIKNSKRFTLPPYVPKKRKEVEDCIAQAWLELQKSK
jgi:hypothetical protein